MLLYGTRIKSKLASNHNQTVVRSGVKSRITTNHNQTLIGK